MPINFILQGSKRPAAVYVRFREGRGTDAKARTQFTVNPEDWSHAKGKAKENNPHCKRLNYELDKFRDRLVDRLNHRKPGERVTTEWLKNFVNPNSLDSNMFLSYFDHYIQKKESEVNEGKVSGRSVQRIKAFRAKLERMGEDLPVSEVNRAFVERFKAFSKKNKYAVNTTARDIKYIATICRDARRNGLQTHLEVDQIKDKSVKVQNIYLTLAELSIIEGVHIPEYLDNARDWLLISCFTGQRISDFMRFKKEMLKEENGKLLLEFTQVKTKKIMTIPVHEKVKAILKKRKGDFPRQISDQKYNDYIKEVCKEAGLKEKVKGSIINPKTNRKESGIFEKWQLVSSHIGRRSFASNFYGIIPTSLLIFVTGHSTESQFYAYIGKSERTKAFQLADYF